MPRKKRKSGQPELLSRYATIASCSMAVRFHAVHKRGEEPYMESRPWLDLHGVLKEPVGDVDHVQVSVHPTDRPEVGTARPASVGSIIQARPKLSIVVAWPQKDFDRVWSMALMGHLKYASLCFTKPRYSRAIAVVSS